MGDLGLSIEYSFQFDGDIVCQQRDSQVCGGPDRFLHAGVNPTAGSVQNKTLASSSSSFTAMKVEIEGAMSTTSGFLSEAASALFHSSMSLPEKDSLDNVPIRWLEVNTLKNRGSASEGGSLDLARVKISTGTTVLYFWSCSRILAGDRVRMRPYSRETSSAPFVAEQRIETLSFWNSMNVEGNSYPRSHVCEIEEYQ